MSKKETVLSILMEMRDLLKNGKVIAPVVVSAPRVITSRFTDNGDGTITDKELKVLWVKDPQAISEFEKTMTWYEAKAACEKLCFAGYNSGWRMPTLKEEQSIRDYTRHDPAWNTDVFGGKHDDWYWTSTLCAWNSGAAWCVGSLDGFVYIYGRNGHLYVRPVRSSQ